MNHARLESSGESELKWRTISATRVVASTLGVLVGVLGMEHGYFETRQGNVAPSSLVINAIGPPCQTYRVWHGCEPALTIIPSFLISGLLAIIVSCIILVWAAAFIQRTHGALVLILLSVVQLLVGGGLTSPFFGVIAGVVGTKIHAPLTWWRAHLSTDTRRLLAPWWPWSLIAYVVWFPSEWILGYVFNDLVLNLTPIVTVLTPALLLLIVVTGFAHDIQRQTDPHRAPSMSG